MAGTLARPLLPADVAPPRRRVAQLPRGMAIRESLVPVDTADFHPIAEAIRRLS